MPDLIIHIAFALLISILFKLKNWKLIITGAILPDISRILITILNFLKFDELNTYLLLDPLHSPFINIFLSVSIALLFNNFLRNFALIYLGTLSHYFLDYLQFAGSFGQTLFYPFYMEQFSLNLFYGGNILVNAFGVIFILIIIYCIKEKNSLTISKNYYLFIIPLIISLTIPIFTTNLLLENNIHGVDFVNNPEKYNNKEVSLYDSQVISLSPIKIKELGKLFTLETKENLKLNSGITITGIYKEKKIFVENIFFNTKNKYYFSLIGLLFYIYLIFKKD